MIGERTANALSRVRTALDRIEAAQTLVKRSAQASEQAALEQARRHDALRSAVAETLRDLDLLIGENGGNKEAGGDEA